MSESVKIEIFGPFQVMGPNNVDLTPRSAKACGLLAMLALANGRMRGRRWLEEHLWSTRDVEQAKGSCRQVLSEIRKTLGEFGHVVNADRRSIWLDECVEIAIDTSRGEFLENIAIKDDAFRGWRDKEAAVREHRGRPSIGLLSNDIGRVTTALNITCGSSHQQGSKHAIIGEAIAGRIADGITQQIRAWKLSGHHLQVPRTSHMDVEVISDVIEDSGVSLVITKVVHAETGQVIHSASCKYAGPSTSLIDSVELAQSTFDTVEAVVGQLPIALGTENAASKSAALGRLALHRMFTYDSSALTEADNMLSMAYEVDENSLFLAWRGLLKMIQSIELTHGNMVELRETATELTQRALDTTPDNTMVHSLVALTRLVLFGDAGSLSLAAERAVKVNPNDPFSLQALSAAKLLAGDTEESYRLSHHSRKIVSHSKFQHWWDVHHCTVCAAAGHIDEAILVGEAASKNAPSRPIHRHLLALYASKDQLDKANDMKWKLRQLEPDFSLDKMVRDPDYPVRTLRKTGLLKNVEKLI